MFVYLKPQRLLSGMKILLETHFWARYRSCPEAGVCVSGSLGGDPRQGHLGDGEVSGARAGSQRGCASGQIPAVGTSGRDVSVTPPEGLGRQASHPLLLGHWLPGTLACSVLQPRAHPWAVGRRVCGGTPPSPPAPPGMQGDRYAQAEPWQLGSKVPVLPAVT